MTKVRDIAAKAKKHISNADRFEREAVKAAETADEKREARDREQKAAGLALIRLHAECENSTKQGESFSKIIASQVGISRSRAYELIAVAGGIPNKIAPKSAKEIAAATTERTRKHKGLSVPTFGTDNDHDFEGGEADDDGHNVIPWPKTIQKPKRNTRPLDGKVQGESAEELAGRTLNLIHEAESIVSRLPDLRKLTHYAELADAATRTAKLWTELAVNLKGLYSEKAKRNA